jgi:ubiquinone/menaquinone biosynthesis C-methylase UbiE/DNA-binding transcriptional ArsR family regulator
MSKLLRSLKAAADPTRVRILVLLSKAELTVSELTQILAQSQPRVSRHLKLLADAQLIERAKEGAWVFYSVRAKGVHGELVSSLTALAQDEAGDVKRDLQRLQQLRSERSARAEAYFAAHAAQWDSIRSLHIEESAVEASVVGAFKGRPLHALLDVGTGTGRMLEVLAPFATRALGLDYSREMLALARTRLENASLSNCQVRLGDMYSLPAESPSFDGLIYHQVLHFADDPQRVLAEGARVLRVGGRLVVVDFAPHDNETLRQDYQHRRLGFRDDEVNGWLSQAGLSPQKPQHLPSEALTVTIWQADKPE